MKFNYNFLVALLGLFLLSCSSDKDDDVNLNQIDLADVTLTVSENAEVGSTIGQINLTNNSSLTVVTSITSGNDDGIFELLNTTLTLAKSLDFETKEQHILTISASANGQTVSGIVTIDVEDKDELVAVEPFVFLGIEYRLQDGLVEDYGTSSPLEEESHYNYDFLLIDQPVSIVNDELIAPNAKIAISAELFSPGTSGFQVGTFNFFDSEESTQADIDGKYIFDYIGIILLSGEEELEAIGEYDAVGGSIIVTDNGDNNYTLDFDIEVQEYDEDTQSLDPSTETFVKFSYTGDFQYSDERD